MKRLLLALPLLLVLAPVVSAQNPTRKIYKQASAPATCATGDIYYSTTSNAIRVCTAANTWSTVNAAGSASSSASFTATGTNGSGYLELPEQSSAPSTPMNGARFFVDSSNRFSWKGENGFVRTFDGTGSTADRVYTLPDAAGTVVLDSNTQTVTGKTFRAPDGSAGAPPYSFGSSTSSGLYWSGGVRVSVGGDVGFFQGSRLTVLSLGFGNPVASPDTFLERDAANILAQKNANADQKNRVYGANGSYSERGTSSELLTLSTSGATTDTTIDLPANSIILSVTVRVTTTIAGVDSTTLEVGDPTTSSRFGSGATLTAGASIVGLNHQKGSVSTDAAGAVQASAAKVRITLSGGADNTPSAGAVRVVIHYLQFVAPTS